MSLSRGGRALFQVFSYSPTKQIIEQMVIHNKKISAALKVLTVQYYQDLTSKLLILHNTLNDTMSL